MSTIERDLGSQLGSGETTVDAVRGTKIGRRQDITLSHFELVNGSIRNRQPWGELFLASPACREDTL